MGNAKARRRNEACKVGVERHARRDTCRSVPRQRVGGRSADQEFRGEHLVLQLEVRAFGVPHTDAAQEDSVVVRQSGQYHRVGVFPVGFVPNGDDDGVVARESHVGDAVDAFEVGREQLGGGVCRSASVDSRGDELATRRRMREHVEVVATHARIVGDDLVVDLEDGVFVAVVRVGQDGLDVGEGPFPGGRWWCSGFLPEDAFGVVADDGSHGSCTFLSVVSAWRCCLSLKASCVFLFTHKVEIRQLKIG